MFNLGKRPGPGRGSLLALTAAGLTAVACLAATGCSAAVQSGVSAPVGGASPSSAPQTGVLNAAPGMTGFADTSPVRPPSPVGPPADPFAGTPADPWADGAAGIVIPAARPAGPFSRDQVKLAYLTTRKLLIAANLDMQTLLGGRPTAFAGLLTSEQRVQFLNGLDKKGLDKKGFPLSTRTWVQSFPPGAAELIGHVIKVHGTMHAKAAVDANGRPELEIDVEYHFVYPIQPPHDPASWMRIVTEDSGAVEFGNWEGAATTFEPWVEFNLSPAGALCGTADGYQHPDYPDDPAVHSTVTPTGTPVDPYAPRPQQPPGSASCLASTAT